MLIIRTALAARPRRGVILLVVLCLLTLLAVLGITFVLYANASRLSARFHVEAQTQRRPDVDPELLLSHFLGQLIYDAPDDEQGVYSGLRGHGLARNMLGMNSVAGPDGALLRNADGVLVDDKNRPLNDVPFNGVGRQRGDPQLPFPGMPDDSPAKDDYQVVNYTYNPADGFLRDPERRGIRPELRGKSGPDNRLPFMGGFNAPYTYPDLNNLFLAAVAADGTVLAPSFHRNWAGFGSLDPDNWRWVGDVDPGLPPSHPLYRKQQPWLKYLVLRPRPADMGPGFPLPDDAGGDVKNLIGSPGGNDSIWLDLDFPVLRSPDGRKYKPLFAPLVMDLDNRVNLNVHGNLRGADYSAHASHEGWGPWEVNPAHLARLPRPGDPAYNADAARRGEWANLFSGIKPAASGRYGFDSAPHSDLPGALAAGPLGRAHSPIDFDGSRETATGNPGVVGRPSSRMPLPGSGPTAAYSCFPSNLSGMGYGNGSSSELTNHPLLYNPTNPRTPDRAFGLADLEALLRHGDTGSQALASELARLCPKNFLDPTDPQGSARRRRLVTLASFDPDRPGVSPWLWTKAGDDAAYSRLPPREPIPTISNHHPSGGAVPKPAAAGRILEGDFGPDGRTSRALTAIRRLNVNRYLPDYPNLDTKNGRIIDLAAYTVAMKARQYMAAEVFDLFCKVIGVGDPNLAPPPDAPGHDSARWDALRWTAQLAANIVDYIDADDYMTPFNWYADTRARRQEWVYGTELPRVVLNEVYVEYANDPSDAGLKRTPPQATRLKGNVWVELHNPFRDDSPADAPYRKGTVQLEMPGNNGQAGYGIYRLILAKLVSDLREPDNIRGEISPTGGIVLGAVSGFGGQRFARPADLANSQGYFGKEGDNQGFYLLGPQLSPAEANPFAGGGAALTSARSEMSYIVPASHPGLLLKPSLVWQRLACPYLPPEPDPSSPYHNPYITVDTIRDVSCHYAAAVGIDGPNAPAPEPAGERASVGRKQPFAGHPSQLKRQQPNPARVDQPQHTFFQHNADATTPGPNWRTPPRNYPAFDWLVHPDRPLISPMELMHVSGFKPHELTQQFRTGDTDAQKFTHRAPWLDEDLIGSSVPQSHRLYRALEFLSTGSHIHGMMTASTSSPSGFDQPGVKGPPYRDQIVTPRTMAGLTTSGGTWSIEVGSCLLIDRGQPGEEVVRVKSVDPADQPAWFTADFLRPHALGFTIAPVTISERLPGKINLNTVWDEETFLALCDPNPSNVFNEAAARAAFRRLKASRTVGGDAPGPNDRPFRGLAAGLTPSGYADGWLQDTLLRFQDPGSPNRIPILASPGQSHPYQTYELLTKIFNNTTTRSNVFAVWVTVGFFEVTDETARPVKLGAEVGRSEGRNVRHRMFAIVDRSVLLAHPGPQPRFDPRAPTPRFATGPVVPYFSIID